jgi:thiosulfate dehydrogenase
VEIHHLHSISKRIDEIAAKRWDQLDSVLLRKLLAHFAKLCFVAYDQPKVAGTTRTGFFDFEHRKKLVFAYLEECITLAFVELLEIEDVTVKVDGLLDIVHLDRDVVDSVNFNTHVPLLPCVAPHGCAVPGVEANQMGRGIVLGAVGVLVALALGIYLAVEAGAIPANADAKPSKLERWLARTSLRATLAREAPRTANPVALNDANLIDGIRVYGANCAVCHGAANGEPSNVARGLYQRPPQLAKDGVEDDPEGVTYWKVDHGIRFTAMPSFGKTLDDQQRWQVTLFLKHMDALPPAVQRVWQRVKS